MLWALIYDVVEINLLIEMTFLFVHTVLYRDTLIDIPFHGEKTEPNLIFII